MDIKDLVNITLRAWALPILASLHAGVPGRQAPLLNATGASRTAFAQSINHLINIGLLERNPGHGHPLRPEFRLTEIGVSAAAIAYDIQSMTANKDQDLLRLSWTLPVLTAIHKPSHFNDIKRNLLTISDRALSQSLKTMESRNWVQRDVATASRPPRAIYQAVNTGLIISRIVANEIRLI